MFFKKSAQKTATKLGNPFISILADKYLEHSLRYFDRKKVNAVIKGKFASLKYTLTGFDPSELPFNEKKKLISVLYDYHIQNSGPIEAKGTLEELGLKVKERLGLTSGFTEGLKDLPEGLFEVQRLEGLTREELEERTKKILYELEQMRAISISGIADHTVELVAERDLLESILYNATDGVFALDRSGNIVAFNKAMENLTGFSVEEVEGKSVEEYIRLFDETVPLDVSLYCAMPGSSEKKAYASSKLTIVGRNGGRKFVRMIGTTIQEGREINIGCVVTLTDITKDIELETMKLDFVSIAAHELRTPLTAMRGYLSLLTDELSEKIDPTFAEYLEKSRLSADRLHILIENLLNISRIEKGTLSMNFEKHNWIEVVTTAVEELSSKAELGGVSLTVEKPSKKLPPIYADITTIIEVLSNLLDNSIRYTKDGGNVKVTFEVKDDQVLTHVIDSGIGIPQASIPHIFKKFYRVSTTVLRAGEKGTGLGLFISKSIIDMHGGKIWVESE